MSQSLQRDDSLLQDLDDFYRDHYRDQLSELVQSDSRRLEVDFQTLRRACPDVADDYLHNPDFIQEHLQEALELHDFPVDEDFSKYTVRVTNIHETAVERVEDVGMYYPKDIAGKFTAVRGQVSRISPKSVRFKKITFECNRCGTPNTVPQLDDELQEPHECDGCERQGPFTANLEQSTEFGVNHQQVRLQVLPEKTENYEEHTLDVELEDDLVNTVAPGDRVAVNTDLELRMTDNNTPDAELVGKARSIDRLDATFEDVDVGPHLDRIEEIAGGDPLTDITDSLAPEHFGDEKIKEALALQLFSGPDLETPNGSAKRGNIHVFLVGDPGLNKSGLLKRVKEISPRAVFTTGSGSTKAGLTASAVQDDFGDSAWTIKGGALVEAHEGVCCIDELDDMDEEDRAGLLESMSDQEINVSKAGMTPTLPANTTVLAAANPKYGRFDKYEPLAEQVDIDPALFSRFDLIFTMTDDLDSEHDRELARHINETMMAAQEYTQGGYTASDDAAATGPVDDEILRAYVAHGQQIVPTLTEDAATRIENAFVSLRNANDEDGPVPTTPRIVEGLNRLAAAHARMRLSHTIDVVDAEVAEKIIKSYLQDVGVDPETGEMDADVVETGQSKSQRDRVKAIKSIIKSEESEHNRGVPYDVVADFATDMDISEDKLQKSIESLKNKGKIYEPAEDRYLTT